MTSAPACANNFTAAAPMPREPPVMTAALPASEIMMPPKRVNSENSKIDEAEILGLLHDRTARAANHLNKFGEQTLRQKIVGHALGMPLDADDPVCAADPLDALNGAIWGAGGDAEVFARLVDGLVVTAVDLACGRTIEPG